MYVLIGNFKWFLKSAMEFLYINPNPSFVFANRIKNAKIQVHRIYKITRPYKNFLKLHFPLFYFHNRLSQPANENLTVHFHLKIKTLYSSSTKKISIKHCRCYCSTIQRILRTDLHFHVYKIQLIQ